jgi:hypothetical protein
MIVIVVKKLRGFIKARDNRTPPEIFAHPLVFYRLQLPH